MKRQQRKIHATLSLVEPIGKIDVEDGVVVLNCVDGVCSTITFVSRIDDTCERFFTPAAWNKFVSER